MPGRGGSRIFFRAIFKKNCVWCKTFFQSRQNPFEGSWFLRAIIKDKVFKHIKLSMHHINHRCIDASQKINFIVELSVEKSFGDLKISVDFVQVVFDLQKITTQ